LAAIDATLLPTGMAALEALTDVLHTAAVQVKRGGNAEEPACPHEKLYWSDVPSQRETGLPVGGLSMVTPLGHAMPT
jgi:hypothetical protein